jgi:hypothetical protein
MVPLGVDQFYGEYIESDESGANNSEPTTKRST